MGWSWAWGLLFVFWTIPAYFSGEVFSINMVERRYEPVFFWVIITTWIVLGVSMIAMDIPLLLALLKT